MFTMDDNVPMPLNLLSGNDASSNAEFTPPQQDGVLVLDKPCGITSAACIARIKRGLRQKKIGHAGTLDPMAGGVLLVLLGQATKISNYLLDGGDKVYSGIIRLGIVTDTWDSQGSVLETHPVNGVTEKTLAREMGELVGCYEQEVPPYSAAKYQGRPLYELARKGLAVPLKKKRIVISRGEAELVGPERVRFRVRCSSGTYIRSLAHSLGKRLGCGAALEELIREYSHPFGIGAAHALEDVLAAPEAFAQKVTGIADALPHWPRIRVSREEEAKVRNGASLAAHVHDRQPHPPGMRALMQDADGKILALAESSHENGKEVWVLLRGLWNQ